MKESIKKNAVSAVIGIILGLAITAFASMHQTPHVEASNNHDERVVAEVITTTEEPTTEEPTTSAKVETMTVVEECYNPLFTNENVELLAHLIGGEAGSDWCDDEMLYLVGSVVINRVNSPDFPNTIYEVIYQEGQYKCTWDGNFERQPSERCYYIAESLLQNGTTAPSNVLYQAQFIQGTVYKQVQNMYFCYGKE